MEKKKKETKREKLQKRVPEGQSAASDHVITSNLLLRLFAASEMGCNASRNDEASIQSAKLDAQIRKDARTLNSDTKM